MLKKSFFNRQTPCITLLITGKSIEEMIIAARKAEYNGANAIAVELCQLPEEARTIENYKYLMSEVHLPFMFILYRNDTVCGKDDEARQKYLLDAAEAGAEVIDVMGDLFDPSPRELTFNKEAIAKQKKLIEEIHARGAKVVMSSHMSGEFLTKEEVLAHLQEQSSRGADILKIVTRAATEEELQEVIATTMYLNKKLTKPFIHLCNGKFMRLHRFLSPALGSTVAFAVNDSEYPSHLYRQPTIPALKAVLENLHWHLDDVQEKE